MSNFFSQFLTDSLIDLSKYNKKSPLFFASYFVCLKLSIGDRKDSVDIFRCSYMSNLYISPIFSFFIRMSELGPSIGVGRGRGRLATVGRGRGRPATVVNGNNNNDSWALPPGTEPSAAHLGMNSSWDTSVYMGQPIPSPASSAANLQSVNALTSPREAPDNHLNENSWGSPADCSLHVPAPKPPPRGLAAVNLYDGGQASPVSDESFHCPAPKPPPRRDLAVFNLDDWGGCHMVNFKNIYFKDN